MLSCHIQWRERQGEMRETAHQAKMVFIMMSRQVTGRDHPLKAQVLVTHTLANRAIILTNDT